jgi:hypothetical protein
MYMFKTFVSLLSGHALYLLRTLITVFGAHEKCAERECPADNYVYVIFIILYYDQQMHNYFTNYHTATCFDTIVSSSDSL